MTASMGRRRAKEDQQVRRRERHDDDNLYSSWVAMEAILQDSWCITFFSSIAAIKSFTPVPYAAQTLSLCFQSRGQDPNNFKPEQSVGWNRIFKEKWSGSHLLMLDYMGPGPVSVGVLVKPNARVCTKVIVLLFFIAKSEEKKLPRYLSYKLDK